MRNAAHGQVMRHRAITRLRRCRSTAPASCPADVALQPESPRIACRGAGVPVQAPRRAQSADGQRTGARGVEAMPRGKTQRSDDHAPSPMRGLHTPTRSGISVSSVLVTARMYRVPGTELHTFRTLADCAHCSHSSWLARSCVLTLTPRTAHRTRMAACARASGPASVGP